MGEGGRFNGRPTVGSVGGETEDSQVSHLSGRSLKAVFCSPRSGINGGVGAVMENSSMKSMPLWYKVKPPALR